MAVLQKRIQRMRSDLAEIQSHVDYLARSDSISREEVLSHLRALRYVWADEGVKKGINECIREIQRFPKIRKKKSQS